MKKVFFILSHFLIVGNTSGQTFLAKDLIQNNCDDAACVGAFLKARDFYFHDKGADGYEYLSNTKYKQVYRGRTMEGANWVKVNTNGAVLWVKFSTLSLNAYTSLSEEITSLGFKENEKKLYVSSFYPLVAIDKFLDNNYDATGFTGYNIIFYFSLKSKNESVKNEKPEKNDAAGELKYYYENGKYGFKDSWEKIIIPAIYESAGRFENGSFARVKKEGSVGFIDKTGKEILPVKFSEAKYDSDNALFLVRIDDKLGFYDTAGKMTVDVKLDYVHYLENGYYQIAIHDSYGIVGKGGKQTVPARYGEIYTSPETVISAAEFDRKYGYIDISNGKTVIPFKYDYALWFSEGFAVVGLYGQSNWKHGYIDKTGKVIIPLKYEKAESFSGGLAAVALNSRYGFIDKTGKTVIPFKYDNAGNFTNGVATVELNGRTFTIDKTGKEVKE